MSGLFGGKSLFDVFNQKPQPHQTQPASNTSKQIKNDQIIPNLIQDLKKK